MMTRDEAFSKLRRFLFWPGTRAAFFGAGNPDHTYFSEAQEALLALEVITEADAVARREKA